MPASRSGDDDVSLVGSRAPLSTIKVIVVDCVSQYPSQ